MNDLIWAYGPMTNGNAQAHGSTLADRGGLNNFFIMQLPAAGMYLAYSLSMLVISFASSLI